MERSYYVQHEGKLLGPIGLGDLRIAIIEGRMSGTLRVRLEGAQDWEPPALLPELADLFEDASVTHTFAATPRAIRREQGIPDGSDERG